MLNHSAQSVRREGVALIADGPSHPGAALLFAA